MSESPEQIFYRDSIMPEVLDQIQNAKNRGYDGTDVLGYGPIVLDRLVMDLRDLGFIAWVHARGGSMHVTWPVGHSAIAQRARTK